MISRIFAKNVRNLAIQQGRKIGELECACGVCVQGIWQKPSSMVIGYHLKLPWSLQGTLELD